MSTDTTSSESEILKGIRVNDFFLTPLLNNSEKYKYSIDPKEAAKHALSINDSVNHPSHYTNGNIECIDAIESSMPIDAFEGFLKGNVMKYLWRYQHKNASVEDLRKAQWYLNKLINLIEKND